jgi:hypothetical protein
MSDIRISERAQTMTLLALLAAMAAAVVLQYPEIKRYLKIEQM